MTTEGTVQLVKILVYSPILSHCLCALFGQMESALTQPMSPCGRQSRQFSPWIRSFSEKNTHFRGGFLWGPGSSNKNSPKHTALIAPFRPLQKAPVAGRCGLERRGDDHRRRWNQPPSNGRCSSDVPLEIRGRVPSPLIEITKRERTKQKLFLYIIYHPYIYVYIYTIYYLFHNISLFHQNHEMLVLPKSRLRGSVSRDLQRPTVSMMGATTLEEIRPQFHICQPVLANPHLSENDTALLNHQFLPRSGPSKKISSTKPPQVGILWPWQLPHFRERPWLRHGPAMAPPCLSLRLQPGGLGYRLQGPQAPRFLLQQLQQKR